MRSRITPLLFAWAALMALTLIMGFAGDVIGLARPGAASIVVIACVAAFKARVILRAYLGLVRCPAALAGFFAAVFVVLSCVAASFLLFPTPDRTSGGRPAFVQTFTGGIE